ncbi:MAG: DUF1501 domain-containing protein [Colwellia sp.]|nr:DUF1501 domain-containing protein [Colwellia sp.]
MKFNRRNFLKSFLGSSLGASSIGATLGSMSIMNSVMAQSSNRFDDYKALVCIFLHGGNDSFNMLVPTAESEYQTYSNIRQNLAFPQANLLSINTKTAMPYNLGMPAQMAPLHQLYQQGQLAFLANCGPLLQPVTKSQALSNELFLPPQLFSHNDQQKHWQSGWLEQSTNTGWAGRMADLIMDTSNPLSMNISLAGSNLFQTGTTALPYSMNASGVENFEALNPEHQWNAQRIEIFERLINANKHQLGQGYTDVLNRAQSNISLLSNVISNAATNEITYPQNNFAQQLKMVATLASTQQNLNQQRQIFFVSMGEFDTHDAQATKHPQLLQKLSNGLLAFQNDLSERGLADNITTFTMSDFGRTLTSNGDGTDHGWGGHQMIMGGAVNGGNIYGNLPEDLNLDSDDDLGDGRMIPTTSVDQYAATLARWFGLTENELNAVLPNLNRFEQQDLGFLS